MQHKQLDFAVLFGYNQEDRHCAVPDSFDWWQESHG